MAYDGLYDEAPRPPRIRFETIGEAWTLFQKQMGVWLGAGALAMGAVAVFLGISGGVMLLPVILAAAKRKEPDVAPFIGGLALGTVVTVVGITLLGAFLHAGFSQMARKQVSGATLSMGDFFDVKGAFGPMLLMSFLVGLVMLALSWLVVPAFLLGGLWMLAGPLIVHRRMKALDAMRLSWRALQPELLMAACYYFVLSLVSGLGSYLLGIGVIFTMPLLYLGLELVYRDFFPDAVSDHLNR